MIIEIHTPTVHGLAGVRHIGAFCDFFVIPYIRTIAHWISLTADALLSSATVGKDTATDSLVGLFDGLRSLRRLP